MDQQQNSPNDSCDGQLRKRKSDDTMVDTNCDNSKDNYENDPFGLDDFFRSLRTCRVGGGSKRES